MKPHPLFLNGQWRATETSLTVHNPATGEAFDAVCTLDRAGVAQAIADAHAAFAGWRKLTARARGDFLRRIADHLEARSAEIAKLITLENGKPLAQSTGEVAMSVDHLRWFAEEGRRVYGRTVPHQTDGKRHVIVKTPIGVVGAISPWNFPLMLAVRKIAPALAAGCPVVLKPASATPLCALAFAEAVEKAGLPAGVFQIVLGRASEMAAEFLANPLCRKITFTGSTEVGQALITGAARTIKPLSLELGGHAPAIVFADAELDRAVEGVMIAKFRNTGQSCIAANRVYVQRPVYAEFLRRFAAQAGAMKVGPGLEPGVQIGPLINEAGLQQALAQIDDAVRRGARLVAGGKRAGPSGWFLEPTILADVPDDAVCMNEETFAPIAPVCVFDDEEEVVRRANASRYGLSAYAFTTNLSRAFRLMESLEAGSLGLNDGVPTTSNCPFGGFKQSGWGRELGSEGLEAFVETKHVSIAL
ncbi:MAG: NAD-dependent succinate-semialdehyde dehydrogenase [Verrucomicrobia bacterium]|nr:NAD-dependent succinate-semialdehyde dehydrogenase [Verrucomicrobiota bacterium]